MDTLQIIIAVIFGIGFLSCIVIPIWLNVEEKNNPDDKASKGCSNLVVVVILVLAAFAILGMCSKNGGEWSPRHTQMQKPIKNNVNKSIFTPSDTCYIINKV